MVSNELTNIVEPLLLPLQDKNNETLFDLGHNVR
jgi:hypothetical protein